MNTTEFPKLNEDIEGIKNMQEYYYENEEVIPKKSTRPQSWTGPDTETNNQPSKTIPDQTMDMQTILKRYAQGLPIEDTRTPIYNGEEYVPDIDRLDLAERMDLKDYYKEQYQDLERKSQIQQNENKESKPSDKAADPGQAAE